VGVAALPETARATDLYERYASRLYGFCLHRLGSREEAEDAVQTTFLNAFRGLSRGVVPTSESAWLFKIAENVCLSRHRTMFRRRRVEVPGDLAVVEETVAAPARADDELIPLEDALAEMPDTQRRALLLREWQGLSYREIAAELEVSQSAVETLIFRARRSLARRLEAPRARLRRVGQAIDVGAALSALKGALSTGAVVKAAVAGVALTGLVAGIATDQPQRRRYDALPAPVLAAPAKQRHVTRVAPQRVDAPRPSFAPSSQQRVTPYKARPKHVTVSKKHSGSRHVVVAPAAPRAVTPPPPPASLPPVAPSEPEAPQGKAQAHQPAKVKPAGKSASPSPTAKPEKPDREAKPKTNQPDPPADKTEPADPGSQGKAKGKNK
jgi:RNA polymerase sigma factor (sigma-70 family)